MTKREVAFFRQTRRSPANDMIEFLRDLGYSDEQIKAQLLNVHAERDAQKSEQETEETKDV